uniref:HVA22-like protein n=2 Tax=Kalanchoe fedtschenkoi TaxID=63787 RepID=A0A7N0SV23_KALFE
MIGSFLTRGLVMILGYAYPAYECYKCVELNKPDIELLLFWCKYWILVAVLTIGERIGDAFISWIPMYSEAKLAFIVYLWFPKTRGTTYVYSSFFRPYLAKHETKIDRNLMELKTRVGDIAVVSFQKAATYSQTRIYDILQYIASQSVPPPRPVPRQQAGARMRRPTANQPPPNAIPPNQEPLSPTSSSSSSQEEIEEEYVVLPEVPKSAPATAAASQKDKSSSSNSSTVLTSNQQAAASGKEAMQIDLPSSSEPKDSNAPPETIMEDTQRVTRARMRRNPQAAVNG